VDRSAKEKGEGKDINNPCTVIIREKTSSHEGGGPFPLIVRESI